MEAHKQFFILIGRSGSGKGTQAELLQKSLSEKGLTKINYVTTGGGFRQFVTRDGYVASLSKKAMEEGLLQPEFLAVWNWSNIFIDTLKDDETVILDGAPRKKEEAEMLHSLISFAGYTNPTVIYVDVSEGWARERLLGRGRSDDKDKENVDIRMNWFETDVIPTLDLYIHDPRYSVLHINGEQTIEEVHYEIMKKINEIRY